MNSVGARNSASDVEGQSVEEGGVLNLETKRLDLRLEDLSKAMHLVCNALQTLRTVINSIHRSHVGQ